MVDDAGVDDRLLLIGTVLFASHCKYSHNRSDVVHCEQTGCLSSHFVISQIIDALKKSRCYKVPTLICLRLHSKHPPLDFLCFLRGIPLWVVAR